MPGGSLGPMAGLAAGLMSGVWWSLELPPFRLRLPLLLPVGVAFELLAEGEAPTKKEEWLLSRSASVEGRLPEALPEFARRR
mmetsp:Transcript_107624/g.343504  ORF Transcript_107624/g.343504 Transcript_107624/m.343504 type:complete len:82 (+) Transcript_107624:585-830(+)